MVDDLGRIKNIERNINLNDPSQQTSTAMVNLTLFNFTRTTTQGTLPLISRLTINNVTNALNGGVVKCLEVDYDRPMVVESTLILVNHCEFLINFMSLSTHN